MHRLEGGAMNRARTGLDLDAVERDLRVGPLASPSAVGRRPARPPGSDWPVGLADRLPSRLGEARGWRLSDRSHFDPHGASPPARPPSHHAPASNGSSAATVSAMTIWTPRPRSARTSLPKDDRACARDASPSRPWHRIRHLVPAHPSPPRHEARTSCSFSRAPHPAQPPRAAPWLAPAGPLP